MHARVSFYEVASGGDTAAGVKGFEDAMQPLLQMEGNRGVELLVDQDSGEGDHHHVLGDGRRPAVVRGAGEQAPQRGVGYGRPLDPRGRELRGRTGGRPLEGALWAFLRRPIRCTKRESGPGQEPGASSPSPTAATSEPNFQEKLPRLN